jgi:hypothetical protein
MSTTLLLSISLAIGFVGFNSPSPQKLPPRPATPVISKCELVVGLPKLIFREGEPIPLACAIVNRSDRPITIWWSGFWPNHLLRVVDEQGIEQPLTDLGQRARRRFSPGGDRNENAPIVVNPGNLKPIVGQGIMDIDIAKLYRLKPGNYRVNVTYEEKAGETMIITSNTVVFKVN